MQKVTKNDSIHTKKEEHTWFCTDCLGNIFPYCHLHEDEEFMSALSENWNTKNKISLEALQNQNNIFSPFELNEISDSPLYDADPDIQFYQNQCHSMLQSCDYYVEDSFNKKLATMAKCDNDYFSMLHLNIRSAVKNLDNFSSYIMGLNHVFPLIGLSETWFKDINKDCYGLDGYKAEHTCRSIRTGGGVSVFIKENIEYFRRTDLSTSNRVMESVFIELEKDQFGKKK